MKNLFLVRKESAVFFVFFFLSGCAGQRAFNWGSPESGFILQYRMPKGQELQYRVSTQSSQTMEMMGQEMESSYTSSITYGQKLNSMSKDGKLSMTVTFLDIQNKAKTAQGEFSIDFGEVIGKSFEVTLFPLGTKVELTRTDELPAVKTFGGMTSKDYVNKFKTFFPPLPDRPIKVGDTWNRKMERSEKRSGLDNIIKTDGTYTLTELVSKGGYDCVHISGKFTLDIEGRGQQMGQDVVFEGKGDGTGEIFFAYKQGLLVFATSKVLIESTAIVSGAQNFTIPIVIETTSQKELIK